MVMEHSKLKIKEIYGSGWNVEMVWAVWNGSENLYCCYYCCFLKGFSGKVYCVHFLRRLDFWEEGLKVQ